MEVRGTTNLDRGRRELRHEQMRSSCIELFSLFKTRQQQQRQGQIPKRASGKLSPLLSEKLSTTNNQRAHGSRIALVQSGSCEGFACDIEKFSLLSNKNKCIGGEFSKNQVACQQQSLLSGAGSDRVNCDSSSSSVSSVSINSNSGSGSTSLSSVSSCYNSSCHSRVTLIDDNISEQLLFKSNNKSNQSLIVEFNLDKMANRSFIGKGEPPPLPVVDCELKERIQRENFENESSTRHCCSKLPPAGVKVNPNSNSINCESIRNAKIEIKLPSKRPLSAEDSEELRAVERENANILFNNDEKPNASDESQLPLHQRDNWDKNIEFLLAVIGFAVDLGNVWRFPYICYKNGGGAFLIPYTIMFILGGLPIFYMEMSLGQYFSSGCLTVWKRVCPMAKGIGYAMCVLNFFTGLYYNTIISWAVFFFVESFTSTLPWTNCNNSWNSANCRTISERQFFNNTNFIQENIQNISTPTQDYFEREVLQVHLSNGIDNLGSIRKPLALYLAIVFIFIYFAIWKGVKSTGKAVWITALLPYFVLVPLLIRGVFLEGAWLGIRYYLYPQWRKITDVDVWVEAAKQIYFSLGPGFGTLMALSSYNKFNHNCRRDALIAASVNYFASFISGLVIFAVLGYMATLQNVNINDVATEGPGLVFQVYPEGLATMQFSSLWSVLFFIMVITLGIDSTFGGLESVITGLCDEYPRVLGAHRGIFIGLLIILIYFCSLPTTTLGGNYVIYLIESYGTTLSLLFIVLIETIIVCWLYGADRFCKNLEEMYGERPGAYWRICWKYISPTILLLIFCAACGQEWRKYQELNYGDYTYPSWAPTLGLLMTCSSVSCIPIYAIYYYRTKTTGSFLERIKIGIRPIEARKLGKDDGDGVHYMANKIKDEQNETHLDANIYC